MNTKIAAKIDADLEDIKVMCMNVKLEDEIGDQGLFGIKDGVLFRGYAGSFWTYDKFLRSTKVPKKSMGEYMLHMKHNRSYKLNKVYYIDSVIDKWVKRTLMHMFVAKSREIYVSPDELRFVCDGGSKFRIFNKEINSFQHIVDGSCFWDSMITDQFMTNDKKLSKYGNIGVTPMTRDYVRVPCTTVRAIIRDIEHVMYPEKRMRIHRMLCDLIVVCHDE